MDFFDGSCLFFPVFWTACMGTPVNDVPIYIASYKLISNTWQGMINYILKEDSGQGFIVLEWIIKCIFHGDVTAFRICLALIHSVPVIYIFRKYCEQYWIGIYLFVASACPMAWMMNGMRQFVAVVIIFSALPLMIRKEYMKVILLVILATTFHMSAIIMLPIVFIVQGKAWNKKTLIFIAVAIVAVFALNNNATLTDSLLQGTEYLVELCFGKNYVLSASIPAVLALNFYIVTMSSAVTTYRSTLGLFKYGQYILIFTAAINLSLSIMFGKWWGLFGIYLATAVARILTNTWYMPYAVFKHGLDRSPIEYAYMYFKHLIILFIDWGICYLLCKQIHFSIIINVILKVVICSVVPNMMLFIFFGRTQEFQYLYSKGKGFIQSKILCKKESI